MSELKRTILNAEFTYFIDCGKLAVPEVMLDSKGIDELQYFLNEVRKVKEASKKLPLFIISRSYER